MNTIRNLSLAIFSGLLFSLSWPSVGDLSFLLFFAFVPLLFLEEKFYQEGKNNLSFFGYSYLAFFTWNAITTWWIYYSTLFGMIGALVFNSLFMTVVFYLFHISRKKIGNRQGYVALVVYWLAWEWAHMQWDLSWPWLTLGNGFANFYKWIQWYEFTGVFGGSLWVLVINILVFGLAIKVSEIMKLRAEKTRYSFKPFWFRSSGILLLILIPILLSFKIYYGYKETENPINVVILQPNVDPYNVKFDVSPEVLLQKMFSRVEEKIDSTTDYLLFPETALTENIWENEIDSSFSVLYIKNFLRRFPRLKIIIGASTYYQYRPGEPLSPTARKFRREEGYFEAYNTALQIDSTDKVQIYHKSKLVVGVEKMPYPAIFKPLEDFAIDLGGTSGSLGVQEERTVFTSRIQQAGIAPVICYESIYGEFVSDFIKCGADVIFILTNDGWWDNTAGYKQHLAYGRLRAIETRRSIARSANTGISCFINQKGDISQPTPWWEEGVIKEKINRNSEKTFYTKYGDFIARGSLFVTLILLLWTIIKASKRYAR